MTELEKANQEVDVALAELREIKAKYQAAQEKVDAAINRATLAKFNARQAALTSAKSRGEK